MNNSSRCGFTLVELLVVMVIIALLSVLAMPGLISIFTGTNINRAGSMISDQISVARQEAVTKNRDVQVRFYQLTNGLTTGWTAMQIWRVEQTASGVNYVAVGKVMLLPQGIIISDPVNTTLSPLLSADAALEITTTIPVFGSVSSRGFSFRPDGSPESVISSTNNYLTLQSATASGTPPKNYYTLQINPITGKVIVFRP